MHNSIELALADFLESFSRPSTWLKLGWLDLKKQYRRTFLGPIWLAVSTAIMIAAFGAVWANIFGNAVNEYLPKVAVGLVVFNLVSQFVVDGSKTFISSAPMLLQTRLPKLAILMRQASFFFFMFLHHFAVALLVVGIFVPIGNIRITDAVLAMVIITMNCVMTQIWLAIVCTRYRDLPMVAANLMQVLFFVSPVIWSTNDLSPTAAQWIQFNPLAVAIESVRNPILGQPTDVETLGYGIVFTLVNGTCAALAFIKYRARLAYWV